MKKGFKTFLIIWLIMFIVLNVCAFVIPSVKSNNFFIVYGTVVLSFVIELICGYVTLNQNSLKKTFYNIPLMQISFIGMFALMIIGMCGFFIRDFPTWLVVVICVIVIAFTLMPVFGAKAVADNAVRYDEKVNNRLFAMKEIESKLKLLVDNAENKEAKKMCEELYENVKYSDSISNENTIDIENTILESVINLQNTIKGISSENLEREIKNINKLLNQRNANRIK